MHLRTARRMRDRLLASRGPVARLGRGFGVELSAEARRAIGTTTPLSIGICGGDGEHRLAVRIHHDHGEIARLVDYIDAHARGKIHVVRVGPVRALATSRRLTTVGQVQRQRHRPLNIGDSIGYAHARVGSGTIACFVKPRTASPDVFVLSNNHVMVDPKNPRVRQPILQPGPSDGGKTGTDEVAVLQKALPLREDGNRCDAAIARLKAGVGYDASKLPGLGELAGVRRTRLVHGETVFKVGRTTGRTRGTIVASEIGNIPINYPYPVIQATFEQQIEVQSADRTRPFSAGGDSGALVVDADRRAVGLLFAGDDQAHLSYVNPFHVVMANFSTRLLWR